MRFLSNLLASTLGAILALSFMFIVALLFLMAVASSTNAPPSVPTGSVLVVEISGDVPELSREDPLVLAVRGTGGVALRDIKEALRKAAADRRIAGVWIKPHGVQASWATLQELRTALLTFRKSGKPLFASGNDYAMSEPDFYLASTAEKIYAAPEAMFELNGFYLNVEFYKNALEKLDVEPQVIRSGKFKSAVEVYTREDLSPENELQLSALVGGVSREFERAVASGRRLPVTRIREIAANQAILMVPEAVRAGLIDGARYDDEVEELLKARLKIDKDEDLETIDVAEYARVPAAKAGIKRGRDGQIAVVYAVGAINSGESGYSPNPLMGGTMLGADTFIKAMNQAAENDRVKAIVVRVNSPGGSASAAGPMWQAVREARKQKPVVISMGDVAASGGYWLATAGDYIVADPLTITGSIGAFAMWMDVSGLFENKLGVTFDGVRTGPHADMLSGMRPLTEEERLVLEQSVGETYETFLGKVAAARRISVAQADSLGQGRVWTGEDAHRNALVDSLGSLETAISIAASRAKLAAGSYDLRIYPRQQSTLEQLTGMLGARMASWWNPTSPLEQAWLESANQVRALTGTHGQVQSRIPFSVRIR